MLEIVCHVPREKNMSGISAIHHSLSDVNAGACNIGLLVQVSNLVDRATVNSHAHVKFGMTLQCLADFQRAQNWRFRSVSKNKRATIARRQTHQFPFCFGETELLGTAHDLLQRLNLLALLVDEQFGVTDDVDEQDVSDLKFHV